MKTAVFFILFLCVVGIMYAQEKRNYTATTDPDLKITVNGIFDESEWQTANWETNFIQHEPVEGIAPSFQTEFAVLYDANNIYVAIRAFDKPDSISMRMTRRDDIDGDLVGVYFDSYFDKRTSFGFIVSAAGVRSDYINSNDGDNEDNTWDPIWWAKTSKTKNGWNAEIRIPLTQLRFEESEEQLWGFQVLRYIFRKDELSSWQAMEREQSGFTSQFGTLNGIINIQPKNSMNITPYVVARTERFEKEPENPFRRSGKANGLNAGLDAKIGLTNYLTMDLTINPDFGQVEADPSQVNLSTYETFFEEKRPFFIEGKNILSYGLSFGDGDMAANNLFYSRRIGRRPHYSPELNDGEYIDAPDFTNIIGAAKVTGKTNNGWSVGVLESVTNEEHAEIKSIGNGYTQSVEPFTNYFVSRVQKDFNEGNTYVGGIITAVNRNIKDEHLEYLHKSAYTGGIDLVHKWKNKTWMIDAGFYMSHVKGTEEAILNTQTAYSRTYQRPDADYITLDSTRTSLIGHGGKFTFGKMNGKLKFAAIFNWKSPGLEINDIGFSPEVDEAMQIFWAGYRWYEPFSIFRNANVNINQWTAFDFGGNLIVAGGNFNGHTQFKNFWNAFGSFNFNGESLSHSALRGGPMLKQQGNKRFYTGLFSNNQKKLTIGIDGGMSWSSEKDFENHKSVELEIGYRPLQSLLIEISPELSISNDKLQYVTQTDYANDKRYIMGTINRKTLNMSVRINYNITPDLTIQFWGQPFIATGDYTDFKYITNSKADNINDRFNLYNKEQISFDSNNDIYYIDDNKDGTNDYSFDKPDFNVKEFLSNLVLRWEYQPGSIIYLVWSQNRNSFENIGKFKFNNDIGDLFGEHPNNIFLVKFSYRIGR
ncbi:DUF5916 domain-containing protein [Prolixibacteraceae bacterium Z1-6]|uniref:DUF5916 domain-containing protein n=1 Tax=Draconibacterium aestuarii TaxID=2998507 RepID=A0A9X3FFF4_9BACT|nr:DUF5916 domain-containing protein [Prolixibacteraceae bacterium Z1-6]